MTAKTTKKMMRRNLISTLAPMLLLVLCLGGLLTIIIFRYIENDLKRSNTNLLESMKNRIEFILRDMEQYFFNFSSNPMLIVRTKEIISSWQYSYGTQQSVLFVNNAINTPVYTNPYLYSVYIYYYGYDSLLCSGAGRVNIADFFDQEWVKDLNRHGNSYTWFKRRSIMPNSFEKESVEVLTLSRPLYSPGVSRSDGILTLNLNADYIVEMFHELEVYEKQRLVVMDSNGKVVLSNMPTQEMYGEEQMALSISAGYNVPVFIDGKKYLLFKLGPSAYGMWYFSLVPTGSSYQLATELITFTFLALIVVTVIGFLIAAITTKRSRDRLIEIIGIFSEYEKTGNFPASENRYAEASNIYDYIIYNLLGIFVKEHRMKTQLRERKIRQDLYELKALQAQINPHFLYNILETLNWKAIELTGGYTGINEIIENLNHILKYCLSRAEERVSLRNEIEYTKCYMAIQNIRFNNRFRLIWKCKEEDLNLKVAKLLFQPFIENSIKHGGQLDARGVEIKIRILHKNNELRIFIIDNGTGMEQQRLLEVRNSLAKSWQDDNHIGLINTNQRLRLMYGEDFSVKIFSRENKGTVIFITIPIEQPVRTTLPESTA
jgi:two-component system sensor histidine kinase YesM